MDSLRVLDLEGRDINAEVEPRQEPGRISFTVPTQGPFVVKSDEVETPRLTSEARQVLPGGRVNVLERLQGKASSQAG